MLAQVTNFLFQAKASYPDSWKPAFLAMQLGFLAGALAVVIRISVLFFAVDEWQQIIFGDYICDRGGDWIFITHHRPCRSRRLAGLSRRCGIRDSIYFIIRLGRLLPYLVFEPSDPFNSRST